MRSGVVHKNYRWLYKYFFGYPSGTPAREIFSQYKYAVYVDSPDQSSLLQIYKWFEYEFFKKDDFIIIFNQHTKSRSAFIRSLEKNNFNFVSIIDFNNLDIGSLKYIFYPFNSITNPYFIYERSAKHIFIAHGESDKAASVNPMVRMYDAVLVSGNIAKQRLIATQIFSEAELNSRVLAVGTPYLGCLSPQAEKKKNAELVLYAPTWEGASRHQLYSSLDNRLALRCLDLLIEQDQNIKAIDIRPHPSTGIKDKRYLLWLDQLIEELVQKDIVVRLLLEKTSYLYRVIESSDEHQKLSSYIVLTGPLEVETYRMVVTDVSSIVACCVYHLVPHIVIVKEEEHEKYPTLQCALIYYSDMAEKKFQLEKLPKARQIESLREEMIVHDEVLGHCNNNRELFTAMINALGSK